MAYLDGNQIDELDSYDGFTDIMLKWYDGKVTACQAHATAMNVGMLRAGVLEGVMEDINSYYTVFQ